MENNRLHIFNYAADIPEEWDETAGSFFLKRKTLQIIEETNPCAQRYYLGITSTDRSVAVTYRHKLDILTYGFGSLRLPVTILGIPCSVAAPGFSFSPASSQLITKHLHQLKGAKLILNSDDASAFPDFTTGETLPSCKLRVSWNSFNVYLDAMRSHYRYRVKRALEKGLNFKIRRIANSAFDDSLYKLYLNVFNRSDYKLEKLNIDFFKKFPADIDLFELNDEPAGFVQTLKNNEELMFMFGGMDYSRLHEYDLYLNMLLHIIRLGIEGGYSTIDLGQTAESVKCRLGCKLYSKSLHAAHKNSVADFIIKKFIHILSYKTPETGYRVFRKP